MNTIQTALVIISAIIVALSGMYFVIPYAIKKGVNVVSLIDSTEAVLATAESVVDGLQLILPENAVVNTVDLIIAYAIKAADAAEQMLKAQQISAEERKETAVSIVNTCLSIVGVERTSDIDAAIKAMVEAAVFKLPDTNA